MKSIIKTAFFLMLTFFAGGAAAQSLNSGYFLDGYTYRHELNPSFTGDSYISVPVLGNTNISMRGNVGLENFLYQTDRYGLTTFLNPDVSAREFLGDLNDDNKLKFNIDMTLFSMGFKAFGGYNTIGLKLRASAGVNIPYDFFDFAKRGMHSENTYYNMSDLSIRSRTYIELGLGHTREIIENLTVGAKLKLLFGGYDFDATIENMNVNLTQNQWLIQSRAKVNTSLKGAVYTLDEDGLVDGVDIDSPGLGGFGLGVDLGANYKFTEGILKGLTISAALLDLGFINWSDNITAYNEGEEFIFNGFQNMSINDNDGKKLDDQLDDLEDDLEKLYNVKTDGTVSSRSTKLAATLNLGVEYALPVYDKLKFGLLSSTQFDSPFTWTEVRLSANVTPVKWFGASASYSYSTYGSAIGLLANFRLKHFGFFMGTDCMIGEVNSQFIPLNSNASFSFGFNIIL